MTVRIAMWSGPRNISTAMMRSWENRPDCSVVDEPFYAYYLAQTQAEHPMFSDILASQSQHYEDVVRQLTLGPVDTQLQYQKHMTHHMLPGADLRWTKHLRHCFLIRDPVEIVASYTDRMGKCDADDIGIIRQAELYQQISDITDSHLPIIDANRVQNAPRETLTRLCENLNLAFDPNMLDWPQGPRVSDGVWAAHWYHNVELSTCFSKRPTKPLNLTPKQQTVVDEVMPAYEYLKACQKRYT